jgi:hypothetical protein
MPRWIEEEATSWTYAASHIIFASPEPFEENGLAAESFHAVGDGTALCPQLVHHARDEHSLLARPRPELLVGERLAWGGTIHYQLMAGTFHCLEDAELVSAEPGLT